MIFSFLKFLVFFGILSFFSVNSKKFKAKQLIADSSTEENNHNEKGSTLTVTGVASTKVKTNIILISISIVTKEMKAANSIQSNNLSSFSVLSKLNNLVIQNNSISTQDFSMTPSYNSTYDAETRSYTRVFVGYEVKNSLNVNLTDLDLAGKLIDNVSGIKGVQINSISFTLAPDTEKEVENSLIDSSIDDAYTKASTALNKVNYEIKRIKSIKLIKGGTPIRLPIYNYALAAGGESAPSTKIMSGTKEVSMTTNIIYEIGPTNSA